MHLLKVGCVNSYELIAITKCLYYMYYICKPKPISLISLKLTLVKLTYDLRVLNCHTLYNFISQQ